jgi:Ca2+-binding RTX toxin-like protein
MVSANGETSAVPPCISTGSASVRCPADGVQLIQVFADNSDDIVQVTADLPGAVFAGPDSDRVFIESSAAWAIDLNSGDDFARPGLGHDLVSGGPGQDTVLYDRRSTGIAVSLDGVANDGAPGEQDNILTDVESLYGGAGDDLLVGGDGNDFLDGRGGNDDLRGGAGNDVISGHGDDDLIDGGTGADFMDGDEGVDTVTYASRTEPVSVTLLPPPCASALGCLDGHTNVGQVGENDTVIAVENATGGSGNDTVLGSSAANVLRGGDGNDSIDGAFGADVLDGGAGIDNATYQARTGDLAVRLDNLANDGQNGEADKPRRLRHADRIRPGPRAADRGSAVPAPHPTRRKSVKGGVDVFPVREPVAAPPPRSRSPQSSGFHQGVQLNQGHAEQRGCLHPGQQRIRDHERLTDRGLDLVHVPPQNDGSDGNHAGG